MDAARPSGRGRHPRGGGAGHPRRGPIPQVAAARRRLLARRGGRCAVGDDQPGDARAADRRRDGRFPDDPQGARVCSASSGPRTSAAPTRSACRPWSSPPPTPSGTGCASPRTSTGWSGRRSSPADPVYWPGSWTYTDFKRGKHGDNSNTQYALLGLHAASEAGVPVKPEVWTLARDYWARSQKQDGSWAYTPDSPASSASMTCAGVSSLIISGMRRYQGQEFLQGEAIQNCGKGGANRNLQRGIDWLARNFQVGENFRTGQVWKFYYLYGLERAGRLAGIRYFGTHDWYRLGAEELVQTQDKLGGFWQGALLETRPDHLDQLRAPVPGQGPCAGPDQQAPARPDQRLEQRSRRRAQPRRPGLPRLEEPADLADRGSRQRDGAGPAPGPDPVLQRPPRARVLRRGAGQHPRVRPAGWFPVRRRLLRRGGIRPGLPAS